jgi:hypothetical protein
LAGKPRTLSLIVDPGMNSMEVEGEEKKDKKEYIDLFV